MGGVSERLGKTPGVRSAEPFEAANLVVDSGTGNAYSARLFGIDPGYLTDHPWLRLGTGAWVRVLFDQSPLRSPGFDGASEVTIDLPGDAHPLGLKVPVGGTVDRRGALPWFAVPFGEVQGDLGWRPTLVGYRPCDLRPEGPARSPGLGGHWGLPPFDPDASDLPSATVESHVLVDHAAYPPDPGDATVRA